MMAAERKAKEFENLSNRNNKEAMKYLEESKSFEKQYIGSRLYAQDLQNKCSNLN